MQLNLSQLVIPPVQSLTQQDLHSRFAHVIVTIERLSHFLGQLLDHVTRVLVEQVHEALQDVQMEGGCDDPAMGSPLVSRTDQQSLSQPRSEESVLRGLVNVNLTAQDQFNVPRVEQEDGQFRSDPQAHHSLLVVAAHVAHPLESLCGKGKKKREEDGTINILSKHCPELEVSLRTVR